MDGKTVVSGVSICVLGAIAITGILKGSDGVLNIIIGAICTITGASLGVAISNATKKTED